MVCFCFKAPETSEDERRHSESGRGQKKSSKSGTHSNDIPSNKTPQAPGPSAAEAADGKQVPVDRESPVSVLSGPGDDVSSDQRKPSDPEQNQAKQEPPQQPPPKQAPIRNQDVEEHCPGHPSSKAKQPHKMPDEIMGMPARMDMSGPRGYSDSHVLPGSLDYLNKARKSGDHPPPQLPGGVRANSPHPSQRLHLQRDREAAMTSKQHGSSNSIDQFEKQRLKQLLQHQSVAQRGATGSGSSYASALPGKSRVLAWLDEADLSYATMHEADNTPYIIKDELSPHSAGKFLSALKMGLYDDLASEAVTRDVLIKRGMQRAQLLPEPSAATTSSSSQFPDSLKSTSRERDPDRQRDRGKDHPSGLPPPGKPSRPPMSPFPAAAGGASIEGLNDAAGSQRQVKRSESADVAGPAAVGENMNGREPSPMMQGLLNKTAEMLRHRSLEEQVRARLAGAAAPSALGEVMPGGITPGACSTGDIAGSHGEEGEGKEEELQGKGQLKTPSAPFTPEHSMMPRGRVPEHLSGPAGSWAIMSPALGMAGSNTDLWSRGQAATPDVLSELGRDSEGESSNNRRK